MNSCTEVLRHIVGGIERAFERFPNLKTGAGCIAFSGGKDSVALAYALASMQLSPRLLSVDMNYSVAWRDRIRALAAVLKLPVEIVDVASLASGSDIDEGARGDLAARRAFLNRNEVVAASVTPCTNCYNCKIISLVHGPGTGGTLSFAHHSTDALASFLKSALMFYDRWVQGNGVFDRDRFRNLSLECAQDLRARNSKFIQLFKRYIDEGIAQTSEPPFERGILHGRAYNIARPLFFVEERHTAALVESLGLRAESSGCGHSLAATTRTPREIIHREVLPDVEETDEGRSNMRLLLALIENSLTIDGTLRVDTRRSRHILLGAEYKGGPNELADKL